MFTNADKSNARLNDEVGQGNGRPPALAGTTGGDEAGQGNGVNKNLKCTDMTYLMQHTKSNSKLMMEMISLYLEQTPPLVIAMKQGMLDEDWDTLYAAVHKMIPSFSIMGMSADYENMAKKIQEFSRTKKQAAELPGMVLQLGNICEQACTELKIEFNTIKNITP